MTSRSHTELFSNILNACVVPAVVSDRNGVIICVNQEFLDVFAYSRTDAVGMNVSRLCPPAVANVHDEFLKRYNTTGVRRILGDTRVVRVLRSTGEQLVVKIKIVEHRPDSDTSYFISSMEPLEAEEKRRCYYSLLQRMMPADVLERLVLAETNGSLGSHQRVIASTYEVAVGFVDLVRFTDKTATMAPRRVVAFLEQIFTEFDSACPAFDVEPVKTVGDAYIFVSRRTVQHTAGAVNAVLMAARCVDIMRKRREAGEEPSFDVRVGVATGRVTAGVVSSSRLAFDVWGSTINLAARLQSVAPVNSVLVCSRTQAEAHHCKTLHFEGPLKEHIKGFGVLTAFSAWNSAIDNFSTLNGRRRQCFLWQDGQFLYGVARFSSPSAVVATAVDESAQSAIAPSKGKIDVRDALLTVGIEAQMRRSQPDAQHIDVADSLLIICPGPDFKLAQVTEGRAVAASAVFIPEGQQRNASLTDLAQHYGVDRCFSLPVDSVELADWLLQRWQDQKQLLEGPAFSQFRKPVVQLAEDQLFVRSLMCRQLVQMGCIVHSYADGQELIDSFAKVKPDLVLLDARMPRLNGPATANWLQSTGRKIPILGVTAAEQLDMVSQCLKSGMKAVVKKPVSSASLFDLLRCHLQPHFTRDLIPPDSFVDEGVNQQLQLTQQHHDKLSTKSISSPAHNSGVKTKKGKKRISRRREK